MTHPKKPKHHKRKEDTMAALLEKDIERTTVNIKWTPSEVTGPEPLELSTSRVDEETGESSVSGRDNLKNDGFATVTVPAGWTGTFHAALLDADGNLVAEGDITV